MFRKGRDIVPGLTLKTRVAGKSEQGFGSRTSIKRFLIFFRNNCFNIRLKQIITKFGAIHKSLLQKRKRIKLTLSLIPSFIPF